ncbi:MAG: type 4a pilus biogenesis protein PilO [Pseudazoarcus pumilus]|nr:type 4a pilus biogenesis protein PilO [Pseudazoarcus pumilus]
MAELRSKLDLNRFVDDFKGLDPNDPGVWPTGPKVTLFVVLLVATVAAIWWFDWKVQAETLTQKQGEEVQLRDEWLQKKRQAVNLDAYRRQLEETDRQFSALLRQLPNKAEMDQLLADINQAGLGRGLLFELFKPGAETVREFHAELPISINIVGTYHDLGQFVADVARMPRIVTIGGMNIERSDDGTLNFKAQATTYRYLDDEELAAQRAQQMPRR